MKKLNAQLGVVLFFLLLAFPLVSAQFDFGDGPSEEDKQTFNQILEPVMKIYNLVKYIASAIAGLVLLWAGISYMMGGSDPKKRDNAKGMAMYTIIGLIIIWAAPLVVNFIIG